MYEQITAPPDVPGKNVFCFFGNDKSSCDQLATIIL